MQNSKDKHIRKEGILLDKWYLDFIGNNGEAMIFYAAKLNWGRFSVPYTSWMYHKPGKDTRVRSRFRMVTLPNKNKNVIEWMDRIFKVEGKWQANVKPIKARLYDSDHGYLDWKCYQPTSNVQLKLDNQTVNGIGYAERLILTAPPWKIPMDQLRWGRWASQDDYMVWIELRTRQKRQWIWLNGERQDEGVIEDDYVELGDGKISLSLDRGVILESEKKILSVVDHLLKYLPGFKNLMPVQFLMADEYKWLSKGHFIMNMGPERRGFALHELVNFKSTQS